jgi:hypothetical protein
MFHTHLNNVYVVKWWAMIYPALVLRPTGSVLLKL